MLDCSPTAPVDSVILEIPWPIFWIWFSYVWRSTTSQRGLDGIKITSFDPKLFNLRLSGLSIPELFYLVFCRSIYCIHVIVFGFFLFCFFACDKDFFCAMLVYGKCVKANIRLQQPVNVQLNGMSGLLEFMVVDTMKNLQYQTVHSKLNRSRSSASYCSPTLPWFFPPHPTEWDSKTS